MSSLDRVPKSVILPLKILGVILCLYLFIAAISGMGEAFKLFGSDFAHRVLTATENPFAALLMGLLATSLVQSSSTTTSIIVGMVAGGALPLQAAVPMIMGANIGTTITAIMVSFGSIQRPAEFERAFSAALLHLIFNLVAVAIIFPLEATTGALTHLAEAGQSMFSNVGGMKLADPMKAVTGPFVALMKAIVFGNPVMLLILTIVLTYGTLIALVKLLKSMVLTKVEAFFDRVLFRDWKIAMVFGFFLTVAVQSSSIPTSLAVPLAGAGVLKLIQVYPFNLGANVGTTISAFLAALATGEQLPVVAAFAHTSFNILGILLIWTIPAVRHIPLRIAMALGEKCAKSRYIPIGILAGVYFVGPIILILLLP